MKVLVTGHSGFVGQNLLARVAGGHVADIECVVPKEPFSLASTDAIDNALSKLSFDAVIHLAAQSHVPTSFLNPELTFETNVLGTVRLLRFLHSRQFSGRFLYVSSGDVYGSVGNECLPATEQLPPAPLNPYASSKLAAESICLSWARFASFSTIVARPFNHLGPGQRTEFAVSRFAESIARVVLGQAPPYLKTGRLDVTRDFLDVRDVIDAYFAILRRGHAGEVYNICSGVERRLADVLKILIEFSGANIECTVDAHLVRPSDILRMVGDSSKIRKDTDWINRFPLEDTLGELLRNQIRINTK